MQLDIEGVAKLGYEAWVAAIKTLSPAAAFLKWDDLGPEMRSAWRTAAIAIFDYVNNPEEKS